jgi:hypothetical protein
LLGGLHGVHVGVNISLPQKRYWKAVLILLKRERYFFREADTLYLRQDERKKCLTVVYMLIDTYLSRASHTV